MRMAFGLHQAGCRMASLTNPDIDSQEQKFDLPRAVHFLDYDERGRSAARLVSLLFYPLPVLTILFTSPSRPMTR